MDITIDYEGISVAELAIIHPTAVQVFNTYNIDYCCGGKRPFREACEKAGVDSDTIIAALQKAEVTTTNGTLRYDTWDAPLIAQFIVQHHHQYVRESIPMLLQLIDKVYDAHGDREPELSELKETFAALADELLHHMEKEEVVLFPGIQRLYEDSTIPVEFTPIPLNLSAPMQVMEDEHTHAGDLIKHIRVLTKNYVPPAGACPTYRVTYKRLQEFDQDLMQHIHLENNVLFAKVKERLNHALN
jgi:regulator of cell morphogenesis and NO signaling